MLYLVIFLFAITAYATGEHVICQHCTCAIPEDGQPTILDCTNRGLTRMPRDWPSGNNSIRATFSLNNITILDSLPPTDVDLEVVFSRCNIDKLYAGLFDATPNIKLVDLSYNMLTSEDVIPEKFIGRYRGNRMVPIALEHLSLAYNQIHSLSKDLFEYLPNLRHLNLEGNDFVVLDIQTQLAISSAPKLLSLNLANNELTDLVGGALETLTSLMQLDLSKNQLDLVPNALGNVADTLEVLILDHNPIMEFRDETFLGLHKIRVLSANNLTKLKYVDADTFAPLVQLKKLSLSNNSLLEEIEREAFGMDQAIDELYINNNALNYIDYKLLPWSKLRVLDFKNNPLECSCDLQKIAKELSLDITRIQDGPLCRDTKNGELLEVYHLNRDMCSLEKKVEKIQRLIQQHTSFLRGVLLLLVVTVAIGATLLLIVACARRIRNKNQSSSRITYQPILVVQHM